MSTANNRPFRRRARTSIRVMMLAILIVAVPPGWQVNRAREQREALDASVIGFLVDSRVSNGFEDQTSVGGCHPASTQCMRTISASGSSSRWRSAAVARPVGVRPITRSPSSDHRKCSDHRWVLGLNMGASASVSGSRAEIRSDLKRLHSGQLSQRLIRAWCLPSPGNDVLDLQPCHDELLGTEAIATALPSRSGERVGRRRAGSITRHDRRSRRAGRRRSEAACHGFSPGACLLTIPRR